MPFEAIAKNALFLRNFNCFTQLKRIKFYFKCPEIFYCYERSMTSTHKWWTRKPLTSKKSVKVLKWAITTISVHAQPSEHFFPPPECNVCVSHTISCMWWMSPQEWLILFLFCVAIPAGGLSLMVFLQQKKKDTAQAARAAGRYK